VRIVLLVLLVLSLLGGAGWLYFFTTPRDRHNYRSAVIGTYKKLYYRAFPLNLTPEELKTYDGTDPDKPIFIAIAGDIFDVSTAPHHYGAKGNYRGFAGVDATKSYFDLCFTEECLKTAWDLSALDTKQLKEIAGWRDFYCDERKYAFVGRVLREQAADQQRLLEAARAAPPDATT